MLASILIMDERSSYYMVYALYLYTDTFYIALMGGYQSIYALYSQELVDTYTRVVPKVTSSAFQNG